MCLGIPGKILSSYESGGLRMAKVQFGGVVREACLQYVPEAQTDDYVVVHVGFAISKLDEAAAARTYKLLEEMGQLAELDAPEQNEAPPSNAALDSDPLPSFPRKRESRDL